MTAATINDLQGALQEMIKLEWWHCNQCGHNWPPSIGIEGDPDKCPNRACNSRNWDEFAKDFEIEKCLCTKCRAKYEKALKSGHVPVMDRIRKPYVYHVYTEPEPKQRKKKIG